MEPVAAEQQSVKERNMIQQRMHPALQPISPVFFRSCAACLIALLAGGVAFAQENSAPNQNASPDKEAAKAEPEKKETTLKLKEEKLQVLVETDGVFQSSETEELILKPEKWASLKVESVVSHGSQVNEGDPLLVLATEDLDKELDSLKRSVQASDLMLRLAVDELRFLKESTAMDLQQSDLAARIAAEELDYYQRIREARDLKSAQLGLDMAKFRLEYAQEELNQLMQMYEADDLTEATEEIILKRTARDVEMAQHGLEEAELRYERQTQVLFPREKQSLVDTQARTALSKAKTSVTLPMLFRKKELDVEQLEKDLADKKERLQALQQDRQQMTVYAPRGGLAFYGQATRGRWGDLPAREKQLIPGSVIPPHQVLLTIVNPASLEVVLSLTESQLGIVAPGQPVIIRPESIQNLRLRGEISDVSRIVQSDGKYLALVKLQSLPAQSQLTPGMTGKVSILAYENAAALLVPESAVFQDDFSEKPDPYVWVQATADAEPAKRFVKLGHRKEKQVEILEGLKAGDEILKSPPANNGK